jgi:NAD+-dependent secondary alcohol dehydrogenase Adh1
MTTMRAMVMRSAGAALPSSPLTLENRPTPTISAPTDVVVRIAGAGVCRTDIHLLTGVMHAPTPLILGHENSGYVHAIGSAVTAVAVGDSVLCYPFITSGLDRSERAGGHAGANGRRTPGINTDGGFCEFLLTTERSVLRVPETADLPALSALTDAGLAAQRACMRASAQLMPTDLVVLLGIGGLGHLALQILRATSAATIIAVDINGETRTFAEQLGAAASLHPDELDAYVNNARVVIDFVGSDATVRLSRRLLAFGGSYIGVAIGGQIEVPLTELVERELRFEGIFVGTYEDLCNVTNLALTGKVRPIVQKYDLEDANRAIDDLANGRIRGRAVLTP